MTQRAIEEQDGAYVVVGIQDNPTGLKREVLVQLSKGDKPVDLFEGIRKTAWKLRPLHHRLLSLKHVGRFGIYECHPADDYHTPVEIDRQTEAALAELYTAYRHDWHDKDNMWRGWIHHFFNEGDRFPDRGRYALQLVLSWSIRKILIWSATPLLLSLVIGFWYMYKPREPGSDPVAITQTAWTISSYIVTTAGGEYILTRFASFLEGFFYLVKEIYLPAHQVAIAILAAITSIRDV
ncbi:hypothetical protein Z517_09884 [Fonsecaea pedrosoi CBS 271.37]|uniref:Uncharacterized protein n=1 Tax=Fonsecaea pedrosoi CBS 271.37 TaxID=1442368 RepID=A0A0D2G9S5_9EURO|nr:uncharacterized protein Z517_09884 [Fonsecaea pedrosoi CBS 271.37]KIW77438.1 hypothetical protein Z517_09884 [Fonsecaea pedrosoi CBS 271.37]